MESKNPLEEIRSAILESQLFGIENEITQMGVSDELLKISDALDKYYGISREPKVKPAPGVYEIKPSPIITKILNETSLYSSFHAFQSIHDLINKVKEPLATMKEKLSINDPVYLNLSSAIVSIALQNVISSINSYQKPVYHDYKRYNLISGVDNEWSNLVLGGLDVFNELNGFDMTQECSDNYEANKKTLLSMAESIREAMLHPRTSSAKSSSSGCLVLALAVSTSIMACFGVFVLFLCN